MAGIVSLINDFRIFNYRPTLGFLNPLLYSNGVKGLNDVKIGANPGCNTDGFMAADGWDPVRPAELVSFRNRFQCWLILCSILGHGSGDARLFRDVEKLRGLG